MSSTTPTEDREPNAPVTEPEAVEASVEPDAQLEGEHEAAGPDAVPAPEPEVVPAPEPEVVPEPEPLPSRFSLDESEADAPPAPDLDALDTTPVQHAAATNLDLPSLELPHPAPEPARPVAPAVPFPPYAGPAGGDYSQNLAQSAYGQPTPPAYGQPTPQPAPTPTAQPSPPPYAPSPYGAPTAPSQGYSQPTYGQQAYGQVVPYSQLSSTDENTWSTAAHWSAIVASVVGLGFLGPLLVMLIQGPKSARVRANAVESLNFEITFIIAMIISILLTFIVIGVVTTPILGIAWLVLRIIASVQTSSGQDYRYPFALRLVK